MKEIFYYGIAGINLCISGNKTATLTASLDGFAEFQIPGTEDLDLIIQVDSSLEQIKYKDSPIISKFRVDDADHIFSSDRTHYYFQLINKDGSSATLSYKKGEKTVYMTSCQDIFMLRFMLWKAYALVALNHGVVPIHASSIRYNDEALLFLGESGTGKSTHSQMWIGNIEGASLLNDDSPLLRIVDGVLYTFGSPWSGKLPCYINKNYTTKALVRISRNTYNKVFKHDTLSSIGAIYPSLPPMFAANEDLADKVLDLVSDIILTTPIYTLTCLPNADAANTLFKELYG